AQRRRRSTSARNPRRHSRPSCVTSPRRWTFTQESHRHAPSLFHSTTTWAMGNGGPSSSRLPPSPPCCGGCSNKLLQLIEIDVRARQDDRGPSRPGFQGAAQNCRRRCGTGAFRDEAFLPNETADRLLQLLLASERDTSDQPPHDAE